MLKNDSRKEFEYIVDLFLSETNKILQIVKSHKKYNHFSKLKHIKETFLFLSNMVITGGNTGEYKVYLDEFYSQTQFYLSEEGDAPFEGYTNLLLQHLKSKAASFYVSVNGNKKRKNPLPFEKEGQEYIKKIDALWGQIEAYMTYSRIADAIALGEEVVLTLGMEDQHE